MTLVAQTCSAATSRVLPLLFPAVTRSMDEEALGDEVGEQHDRGEGEGGVAATAASPG